MNIRGPSSELGMVVGLLFLVMQHHIYLVFQVKTALYSFRMVEIDHHTALALFVGYSMLCSSICKMHFNDCYVDIFA